MEEKLSTLLTRVADKSLTKHRKTSYGLTIMNKKPCDFWSIKPTSYTTFWREYCNMIKKSGQYCIGEVSDYSAVVLEFTFRFTSDKKEEEKEVPITNEFICDIIDVINDCLRNLLVISEEEQELICVVLTSEKVWEEGVDEGREMCYGVRFQYPCCNVSVGFQKTKLRTMVIRELKKKNMFKTLQEQPRSDWEHIIDENIPYNYLPLYGSKVKFTVPNMVLNAVYSSCTDEDSDEELLKEVDLNSFNPATHSHVVQKLVSYEMFNESDDIETWLPIILSSMFWPVHTLPKEEGKQEEIMIDEGSNKKMEIDKKNPNNGVEFIDIFMDIINKDRIKDDLFWLDLGRALYNATDGGDEGVKKWIMYSKKVDCYDEEQCFIIYPNFRDSCITYKTIGWYAKLDNPEKYNQWFTAWVNEGINRIFEVQVDDKKKRKVNKLGHAYIAEAFYRANWLTYSYATNGSKIGRWYRYESHRWKQLPDGSIDLSKDLSGSFTKNVELFRKVKVDDKCKLSEDDTENEKKLEDTIGKTHTLLEMLNDHNSKEAIIKECRVKFYIENFEKRLDSNPLYIGMLNCVVEIKENKSPLPSISICRSGKPEDYISMITGQSYRNDFKWESAAVKKYLKYLSQVFPDEDLCRHVRKDIASMLKGRNAEKLFRVYSGGGDNSKSVFMKLLQKAFGSYCIDLPVSSITGKRTGASNATPELARAKGAHIAITCEPDDDEQIKAGIVKSMTGNDRFFARFLHDNGSEIESMYKLILVCNKIPPIPNGGKAIKGRVLVFPFLATFSDSPPQSEEEQYKKKIFKKDPDFDSYIPELAQAMIWCAIKDYELYAKEGLSPPAIIKNETDLYWEENDPYCLFIKDCIEYKYVDEDNTLLDENATVLFSEIYKLFKTWHREAFPGSRIPDAPIVKIQLKNILGEQHKDRRWHGIVIKSE